MRVYGGSKLANLLFVHALAERLAHTNVTVNAVHPGAVRTNLGRSDDSWYSVLPALVAPFFKSPERGATASLHAACAPSTLGRSGAYYVDEREVEPAARARDTTAAERLWQRSLTPNRMKLYLTAILPN